MPTKREEPAGLDLDGILEGLTGLGVGSIVVGVAGPWAQVFAFSRP